MDLGLSAKPALEFTTLEVRIIEHLITEEVDRRVVRYNTMMSRPSTRRRPSEAEFDMSLEPLRQMIIKIGDWLRARRAI